MKKPEGRTVQHAAPEHLVFKDLTTLLVRTARVVPQVENPGNGEDVSYLVHSGVGERRAALLVRVDGTRGSHACWQVQSRLDEKYMTLLGTFHAALA